MSSTFAVTSKDKEKYLHIIGTGNRNTVVDILNSAKVLMSEIGKYSQRKIVLDYSRVTTHANYSDVFNISRIHEQETPELTRYVFAVVVNPQEWETELFWEETNRKRGLNTKVFISELEAIVWLDHQR